ncbi:hypothetical protein DPMN_162600 [Dreissena polymorpha]|uniref:Uncharacterized protein n=1 Tax=Dreissena polymorpha TaxID=45954 RepID=A0A9D4EVD7_DREPO|nr:hypothetical protein DPMN_162600 [Dreissena polymorpha]
MKALKAKNIRLLDVLLHSETLKRPTAENISRYELALCHLKAIFSSSGEDDFRDTFIAKNIEGLPKVTNAKK